MRLPLLSFEYGSVARIGRACIVITGNMILNAIVDVGSNPTTSTIFERSKIMNLTLSDCDDFVSRGFYVTIKNRGIITYILIGKESKK